MLPKKAAAIIMPIIPNRGMRRKDASTPMHKLKRLSIMMTFVSPIPVRRVDNQASKKGALDSLWWPMRGIWGQRGICYDKVY